MTIQGQAFDSNAANDTVNFNGTVATVLSATATQLVTMAPSGATTGPISVNVGSQAAISASPFVIDDTGLPPGITQVSPTIVSVGSVVTVKGTHLDPISGDTTAQMDADDVPLSSVSDTQLQYTVPSSGTTGYVSVETPYGQSTSTNVVAVLPASISATSVVTTGTATLGGSPVTLDFASAGQVGIVEFEGNSGSWLSLQASNLTSGAGNISYTIYGPENVVIQSGTLSASAPSIHLPVLVKNGTYLAVFVPTAASTQFAVALESAATLTTASPLTQATTIPTESKRFIFAANGGDNLELTLTNLVVSGGSQNAVEVEVFNPAGTLIDNYYCNGSTGPSCDQSLWNLTPGTYSVVVLSYVGATLNFTALLKPDVVSPFVMNTPMTVTLGVGQVERLTFNANAGDTVTINVSGASTVPAGNNIYIGIWSPAAGSITTNNEYTNLETSSSNIIELTDLPATGTYTVIVSTSATGLSGNVQMMLVPSVTGVVLSSGTGQGYATNYATSVASQNVELTFNANAGNNFELTLTDLVTVGGSTNAVEVQVYDPNGVFVANYYCQANAGPSCDESLWNLTAGTYRVVVIPYTGATISFNVLLQPDVIGQALTLNAPVSVNLGVGQVEWLTFTANAGDTATINVSGASTTPAGKNVYFGVWSPGVGTIMTSNSYQYFEATSSTTINLPNLPASGTYTVIVSSGTGLPVSATLSLTAQ